MLGAEFPTTLAAAQTGAEWAWARIYRDLAPALLGYARARGAPEPEDLVGEVFLQLARDLARFEGGEPEFRAWVFTVARHRIVDDGRRRRRRPVEPVPEVSAEHQPTADAEEEALGRIGGEWVMQVIGALGAAQRDVVLLRVLGDLTVEQVARAVGKSPGAVKALQRRGLAEIKSELARQGVPT